MSVVKITNQGLFVGLDHQQYATLRWRELADFVGQPDINSFLSVEPQVMVGQVLPMGVSEAGAFSQDRFGSGILNR